MTRRNGLSRRRPFRRASPRILIVCEGKKTEPGYFAYFRKRYRGVLEIKLKSGDAPRALVDLAVKLKTDADRAANATQDPNLLFDEVWCVFDVDGRKVASAKRHAVENGIQAAISNPCFELWALLHFQDQRAQISATKLKEACRKYMPGYEKELPTARLEQFYDKALANARSLDAWQRQQGRGPDENPSTGVYRLTEAIKSHASAPGIIR